MPITAAAAGIAQVCTAQKINLQAFLSCIRYCETDSYGVDSYYTRFGGGQLSSLNRHPGGGPAGAYQMKYLTWKGWQALANVKDFSPASQDIVATTIIYSWCKALADIQAGNLQAALAKCAWKVGKHGQWSSLPGSTEQRYTYNEIANLYESLGGTIN